MKLSPTSNAIKRYRGKWTVSETLHLLRRTMFGASPPDVAYFTERALKKSINELLDTQPVLPPPPVNNYNEERAMDDEIAPGQTWVNATKKALGLVDARRRNSYKSWWTGAMMTQNRSISEKMVLFWHNHFATETANINDPFMCYQHNLVLRQHALGNFKMMVRAVTTDPAMLKYLNGNLSTKKAPDENYGRELQELFTVGKENGTKYTEADVKAAAKVLTGFKIENKIQSAVHTVFDPARHDTTQKSFSSFYGSRTIEGAAGPEGEQELDDLLNMIFEQPEVSKFICRKLYRFFVYHDINEQSEQNIIEPLAKTFRKNNYEIKPVLKQLFQSRHFYDTSIRGAMIKSPVDFTVGLCREFNMSMPDFSDYGTLYFFWNNIQINASRMQQNIGDPPNVAGWPAYYQAPQFDKIWINSDTLFKRNQFTDLMITNGYAKNGSKMVIDPFVFAKSLSRPEDADQLIEASVQALYMVQLPASDKKYIKEAILLSGLQGKMTEHYWTDAWQKAIADPQDAVNLKDVVTKLKNMYKYLMNLGQYQLC